MPEDSNYVKLVWKNYLWKKFDEQLNYINYKIKFRKLHGTGFKNSSFTSDDVSMIGCGCGVSQYPQFYYQELDRYQVLPHPYRGYFEGLPGENIIK